MDVGFSVLNVDTVSCGGSSGPYFAHTNKSQQRYAFNVIERFNTSLRLFIRVSHIELASSVSLLMFSPDSELIKWTKKYKFAYFMTLEMFVWPGIDIM